MAQAGRIRVHVPGMLEAISITAPGDTEPGAGLEDTAQNRDEAWHRIPTHGEDIATEFEAGSAFPPRWLMWQDWQADDFAACLTTADKVAAARAMQVPEHINRTFLSSPKDNKVILVWKAEGEVMSGLLHLQRTADGNLWGFFPKKLADSMPSQGRTWLVMACRGGIANTTYALRAFPEAALDELIDKLRTSKPYPVQQQQEPAEPPAAAQQQQQQQRQPAAPQAAGAPAWGRFDPACRTLSRPNNRTVWVSEEAQGSTVAYAALCCTSSVLREGASTIPKGLASQFWGVDAANAATFKVQAVGSGSVDAQGRCVTGAKQLAISFKAATKSIKVKGLGAVMKAGNGGSKLQAGSWLVLARLAAGSYAAHVYAPESQAVQLLEGLFKGGTPAKKSKKRQAVEEEEEEEEEQRQPKRQAVRSSRAEPSEQQALQAALAAAAAEQSEEEEEEEEEDEEEEDEDEEEEEGDGQEEASDDDAAYASVSSSLGGARSDAEGPEETAAAAEALGMLGTDVAPEQSEQRGRLAQEAAELAKQRAASAARRQAEVSNRDARAAKRRPASPAPAAEAKPRPNKRKRGRPRKFDAAQAAAAAGPSQQRQQRQQQQQPHTKQSGARPIASGTSLEAAAGGVPGRKDKQRQQLGKELAGAGKGGGAEEEAGASGGRRRQPLPPQQQLPQPAAPEQPPAQDHAQPRQQAQRAQAEQPRAGGQPDLLQAAQQLQAALSCVAAHLQAQVNSGVLPGQVAEAAQACGLLGAGRLGLAGALLHQQQQPGGGGGEGEPLAPLSAGLLGLLDDVLGHRPALLCAVEAWMQAQGVRYYEDLGYADGEEMRAAVPGLTTVLYNKLWDHWERRGGFGGDDDE